METLELFPEEQSQNSISSHLDSLAKILALPESEQVLRANEVVYSLKLLGLLTNTNPTILSLKTSRVFSQATEEKTLSQHLEVLPTLVIMVNFSLLILPGFSPKIERGSSLSDILQQPEEINQKYFLSEKMTDYLKKREQQEKDNHKPKILSQL